MGRDVFFCACFRLFVLLLASFSLTNSNQTFFLSALPDSLELPSDVSGIPPPTQAVTEAISAVTDSAPPAPEITEAVTSSLPSIPDVSLPSVSLPDISDVSTNNRATLN